MLNFHDHLARFDLRIREHVADLVDRTHGHARASNSRTHSADDAFASARR
jgi:hypothetical protein